MKIDNFLLFSSLQYYVIPLIYGLAVYLNAYHQAPIVCLWIIYTAIPLLDSVLTMDLRNPTKQEVEILENKFRFKVPLYLAILCDWLNAWHTIHILTTQELNPITIFFTLYLAANLAGSNINVAHELIHKDNFFDKFIGTLTLARNLYLHWGIEHVYGHHKWVATPNDPATSKKGQSLYQFLPQTMIGTFKSAWHIESNIMKMRHGRVFVVQNKMLWYILSYLIIPQVVYKYFGLSGMIYFLITAIGGATYLEFVNYIEHYGLQRKEISPGQYEQVNITHSWNAPHRMSNYFLFKLQRHSDHHENGYKEYQTLCSYEQSPQLPHGYFVCIVLSYFPSLWFYIMDKQLESWKQNSKYVPNPVVDARVSKFIWQMAAVTTPVMLCSILI